MPADFLDSNVIIYMFDADDAQKQRIASELVPRVADSDACISFQVVQEVLRVLGRQDVFRGDTQALSQILSTVLVPPWLVLPSEALYFSALAVQSRYRYSFYDSLIIAAALEAGCSRLYSEDLQDRQRIEGMTIVNPFA